MERGTHREVHTCGSTIALSWAAACMLDHTQRAEQLEIHFEHCVWEKLLLAGHLKAGYYDEMRVFFLFGPACLITQLQYTEDVARSCCI